MEILTALWSVLVSIYARTIGAFIMWTFKLKEQIYKIRKARSEALKAELELKSAVNTEQFNNSVRAAISTIQARMKEQSQKSGPIDIVISRSEFLEIEGEVLNEAFRKLLEGKVIRQHSLGVYVFSRLDNLDWSKWSK